MSTPIVAAIKQDSSEILRLAKSFDLDVEDFSHEQFLIARKENQIIGFGRLRKYNDCTEVATVGVIHPERNRGVGTSIVKELIQIGPKEIFVTCVIPNFFSRVGFEAVKHYPSVLRKKVDFCKLYNFSEEEIFVMKITK
jgi:N-acetylglutamate synthase-like GNAT family acetyltransferase